MGTCRLGGPTQTDRNHFTRLCGEYLCERREGGSPLWADEHNLRLHREAYDSYTRGSLFGLVVFWSPHYDPENPMGFVLVGEEAGESLWHTDYGKLAMLWGVYVSPPHRGHRVGLQMESYGRPKLWEQGFRQVKTLVEVDNNLGRANWSHWDDAFGVKTRGVQIIASLAPLEESQDGRTGI